jgi:DNA helicase-2/ATP-dependent DNA helicase PcrA
VTNKSYAIRPSAPKSAAPKSAPGFSLGDRVKHKAFGPGRIVKMTPMGGDYLIEVAFEEKGTKKLMLRAAALVMEKL